MWFLNISTLLLDIRVVPILNSSKWKVGSVERGKVRTFTDWLASVASPQVEYRAA